jgi:hypothetical protein
MFTVGESKEDSQVTWIFYCFEPAPVCKGALSIDLGVASKF